MLKVYVRLVNFSLLLGIYSLLFFWKYGVETFCLSRFIYSSFCNLVALGLKRKSKHRQGVEMLGRYISGLCLTFTQSLSCVGR